MDAIAREGNTLVKVKLHGASDPRAGERRDRELALREECIRAGRAAFRARNPRAEMTREQAGDLVGRCFSEARRDSN